MKVLATVRSAPRESRLVVWVVREEVFVADAAVALNGLPASRMR